MPSKKKHILQPPNLPAKLGAISLTALANYDEYAENKISSAILADISAKNVLFEECLFRRVTLTSAKLPKLHLRDVRLEGCDLSAASLEKARLRRGEFSNCRLIGVQMLSAEMDDVLFKECNLEGAVFVGVQGKHIRFEDCQLKNATFESADLEKITFTRCDLSHADFRNVKFKAADLRSSIIDGIVIDPKSAVGLIISPMQAIQVVTLLGVVVQDDGDME